MSIYEEKYAMCAFCWNMRKCGNKQNMRQSHIRMQLTCLARSAQDRAALISVSKQLSAAVTSLHAARPWIWSTKVRRQFWHSAGSLGWPFPTLKYLYFLQIKYTKAILSNRTRRLLWSEITKMLIAVSEKKFTVSFIIIFGTLSFPMGLVHRTVCLLMGNNKYTHI